MSRFVSMETMWSGALWLIAMINLSLAQLENPPAIVQELQRQQRLQGNVDMAVEVRLRMPQAILGGRVQLPQVAQMRMGRMSAQLMLFENDGKLQFYWLALEQQDPPVAQRLHLTLTEEDAARIVKHYVDQCREYCDARIVALELQDEQIEKLEAAAAVDASRFVRRLRAKFSGTADEQRAQGFDLFREGQAVNKELQAGIRNPQSLFRKVLGSVLTPDQQPFAIQELRKLRISAPSN